MEATLNLSYNQILSLVKQLPVRIQLRLGRQLTKDATQLELEHFLSTFKTDELSEDEIMAETEKVRKELYARKKEKSNN